MEKADILEMTVAYLRAKDCRSLNATSGGGSVDRYAAGFRECAVRVGQYLLEAGVSVDAVYDRLMSHLDKALRAAADVDSCGRLSAGAGVESTADVAVGKVPWTGDCDTTGRCSPGTDDDDCGSVSETVSDTDDVDRRRYVGCEMNVTAGERLFADTNATTATPTTYRQPLYRGGDADSPRSADEFPTSFQPTSTARAAADRPSSLPRDIVDDIDNDLFPTCDVTRDVIVIPHVTCSGDVKSLSVTSGDIITDDSADLWQPWR